MAEIQMRKAHSIEAGKVASNGSRFYLVRWEGQNDPSKFTWIPETEFDPHSDIVTRFLSANLALYADETTQTDESIWVFKKNPQIQEYDYFKKYVPNSTSIEDSNSNGDLLPINIINYDPTNKTFETIFADKPEPKWIEGDILLSLAPELIARYFIYQKSRSQ